MNTTSGWLAIGALSERTGCKVETIRFYERARLLPAPERSPGGYRLYSRDNLKRLTFICRARALGFSIDEVRKLLTLADERKRPCAEVRVVAGAHLESELFGHERGAFTDAHTRRQGLMAQADGGTLFLDEVDTLTPRGRVALLRALQDKTFRPLGSTSERRVDVRFLAATNARLEGLVQAGSFRADLYYRLCVFSVTLPPLRERREDILPLAGHFLAKYAGSPGPAPQLSAGAVEVLLAWDWPGNVRELESAILRALAVAKGGSIETGDLGLPAVAGAAAPPPEAPWSYKAQKRRILEVFQRHYLIRLMTEHRGNVSRAARAAGKERRDLGKLLKRHGLDPRQFMDTAGSVPRSVSTSTVAVGRELY
jgi:DNA-binding NtrC family response regulator